MLNIHKPEQGMLTRWIAFWAVAALVIWGGFSLYSWMVGAFDFARTLLFENSGADGFVLPVLEQRFNVAFLVAWVVIIGGVFVVQRMLLANPSNSEFLITTDEEVRKVSWPSWKDAKDSAVVVLIFVGLLALFLVASDRAVEFLINLVMKIA